MHPKGRLPWLSLLGPTSRRIAARLPKQLAWYPTSCGSRCIDGPGIRTTMFLKGCLLTCWWCHNPENQDFLQSLMFFEDRCLRCGGCASVCPQGAVVIENGAT